MYRNRIARIYPWSGSNILNVFPGVGSLQTMEQVCAIPFSTAVDSDWVTSWTMAESSLLLWTQEEYDSYIGSHDSAVNGYCSCGSFTADDGGLERIFPDLPRSAPVARCSQEQIDLENAYLQDVYDDAVATAAEEGGVAPQLPLGLGGVTGQGALDKVSKSDEFV